MAGETARKPSVFDQLKAGAVIVEKGGQEPIGGKVVEAQQSGTGDGNGDGGFDLGSLPVATEFGPDPNPDDFQPGDYAGNGDGDTGANSGAEKAGAPRGRASPNYGTRAKKKANLGVIESALIGIHGVAATLLNNASWALSPDEAKNMAEALAELQSHYDIALDEKTEAWLKVVMVAGAIYGPRVVLPIVLKRAMKKEEPETPKREAVNTGNVVTPMNRGGNNQKGSAFVPSQLMPMGMGSGAEENPRG